MADPIITDVDRSGSNVNATSRSIKYPAYSTGDLIVGVTVTDGGAAGHTFGALPDGETLNIIADEIKGGASTGPTASVYWWIATSDEAAGTFSLTMSVATKVSSLVGRVPAGDFDPADPIPDISAAASQATDASSISVPPSDLTPTVSGGIFHAMGGIDADPLTGIPTGWAHPTDYGIYDIGGVSSWVAYRTAVTVTSTALTPKTFSYANDTAAGIAFVIAPPASALTLAATGSSTSSGTATLGLVLALRSTGTTSVAGSAALSLEQSLAATGSVSSSGTATLGLVLALRSTGTASVAGSAALSLEQSLAATGSASSSGTATLGLVLALRATGATSSGGSAAFYVAVIVITGPLTTSSSTPARTTSSTTAARTTEEAYAT